MKELSERAVIKLLDEDVRAWNQGDLKRFCRNYALDATYITSEGCVKGRENILARYRERYPDISLMGLLSLQLVEFRSVEAASESPPKMASALLKWRLTPLGGEEQTGFSLIVLISTPDEILILQDASF